MHGRSQTCILTVWYIVHITHYCLKESSTLFHTHIHTLNQKFVRMSRMWNMSEHTEYTQNTIKVSHTVLGHS